MTPLYRWGFFFISRFYQLPFWRQAKAPPAPLYRPYEIGLLVISNPYARAGKLSSMQAFFPKRGRRAEIKEKP